MSYLTVLDTSEVTSVGNVYHTFTGALNALEADEGLKVLQLRQAEAWPSTALDLNGASLSGYTTIPPYVGGEWLEQTFPEGCTISGLGPMAACFGLVLHSQSDEPVISLGSGTAHEFHHEVSLIADYAPLIDVSPVAGEISAIGFLNGSGPMRPSHIGYGGTGHQPISLNGEAGSLVAVAEMGQGATVTQSDSFIGSGGWMRIRATANEAPGLRFDIGNYQPQAVNRLPDKILAVSALMMHYRANPAHWTDNAAVGILANDIDELAAKVYALENP